MMTRLPYYILEGHNPKPVHDCVEWGQWFDGAWPERGVARTVVGMYEVSTVFLGIDHNWGLFGPPLLFETMVFGEGEYSERMERCSTWEQAEIQHAGVVSDLVKATGNSAAEMPFSFAASE